MFLDVLIQKSYTYLQQTADYFFSKTNNSIVKFHVVQLNCILHFCCYCNYEKEMSEKSPGFDTVEVNVGFLNFKVIICRHLVVKEWRCKYSVVTGDSDFHAQLNASTVHTAFPFLNEAVTCFNV